jgi:8-oxo-dGTP pyrophosphatase MutT (NUDIX family)
MPHIHEKVDFCSEVFIVYKNKVLIRKHDKSHKWLGVGGHVELDEMPDVAAVRESKEEVGLDITLVSPRSIPENEEKYRQLIPPWFMRQNIVNEVHTHADLVYFATTDSDNVIPEQPQDEWKWFSLEDLETNELKIEESVIFYAKEALKELA